ncbi:MAG: type IV pilus assembly protein PilM [Candidatus Blackburnbacteria bacterium]|nr:type IV pilus assembly protein PilM [Candidatus Blackburnbacteria bacterium]
MSVLGLDIGTKSIKVAQLEKRGDLFSLLAAGVTSTPGGGLEAENEKDLNLVAQSIKKLLSDTKVTTDNANIVLPENKVITRFIKLPYLTDQEIDSAISWQAEPYIPIPISEANISHQVLKRNEPSGGKPGSVEVLLVAAAKTLILKYMKVAQTVGINPVSIETELLALQRSVCPNKQTVVLVDFGSSSTSVGVVRNGHLVISYSIASGGDALTRAVSKAFNMDFAQAEQYKRAYGLDENQVEGKVAQALKPVFVGITDEIKKAVQYYKTEIGDPDPVTALVLAGGSSALPGIVPFLTEALGLEVLIADPFLKITKDQPLDKSFLAYAPLYGVAIGAAENQ